jgi:hypothetical protein
MSPPQRRRISSGSSAGSASPGAVCLSRTSVLFTVSFGMANHSSPEDVATVGAPSVHRRPPRQSPASVHRPSSVQPSVLRWRPVATLPRLEPDRCASHVPAAGLGLRSAGTDLAWGSRGAGVPGPGRYRILAAYHRFQPSKQLVISRARGVFSQVMAVGHCD